MTMPSAEQVNRELAAVGDLVRPSRTTITRWAPVTRTCAARCR